MNDDLKECFKKIKAHIKELKTKNPELESGYFPFDISEGEELFTIVRYLEIYNEYPTRSHATDPIYEEFEQL